MKEAEARTRERRQEDERKKREAQATVTIYSPKPNSTEGETRQSRLKRLRLHAGYSQMQLANLSNMTVNTVYVYESEKRSSDTNIKDPRTRYTMERLAKALHVSVEYLTCQSEDPGFVPPSPSKHTPGYVPRPEEKTIEPKATPAPVTPAHREPWGGVRALEVQFAPAPPTDPMAVAAETLPHVAVSAILEAAVTSHLQGPGDAFLAAVVRRAARIISTT